METMTTSLISSSPDLFLMCYNVNTVSQDLQGLQLSTRSPVNNMQGSSYRRIQAVAYSANQEQVSNTDEPALLFNFMNIVSSLEEATQIIVEAFGRHTIVSVKRQLCQLNDWFKVEVLFTSEKARDAALMSGVTHKGRLIKPKPLFPIFRGYLVVDISDLPIESSSAADYRIRQSILHQNAALQDFKVEDVILNTTGGVYNNTARAVLSIKVKTNLVQVAQTIQITYNGNPSHFHLDNVYACYAFCYRCKKLDDHEKNDCTARLSCE